LRERRDHRVHSRRRIPLEQRLETAGAIAFALPAQHRFPDPRPPRLDRLPHRNGDVGEEVAELVSAPTPASGRPLPPGGLAAVSGGGRSLVSTIWCPPPCSASVRRNSSDCISLRFVRNCTSSTSSTSTFWKRRRNASPCPAAIAAWNASTYSSRVRYSMFSAG